MSDLYQKLSDDACRKQLAAHPKWSIEDGKLCRTFVFESYAKGVLFAVAVAHTAERLDHHPDIVVGYQKVEVQTHTHSANGITLADFRLVEAIDQLG